MIRRRFLRSSSSLWLASVLALLAVGSTGCAELLRAANTLGNANNASQALRPIPPNVSVANVQLESAPTNQDLAIYYCYRNSPLPICGLIGPQPDASRLQFTFRVDLDIENRNAFPLPVVEMLAAFTAFPEATGRQNLGAACLSLCEDPASCPQNRADACRSSDRDIRGIGDFVGATVNFLVAVAQGNERFENLRIRTIAANQRARASLRLTLNADVALQVIGTLAQDAIQQAARGQVPRFAIPYRFEGSLWINIEHFGRLAVNVPAYTGTWNLQ